MAARLRFLTCGSVDDGKSTLIGRLLFDTKQIFDDQFQALRKDSARYGTQGAAPDFALLVDGLQAEREQGITIDVAYRFFATPRRAFIVADAPGHEQYTRNMAVAASTADAAVVLVDARKGVLTQTRRHSRILALMGVQHVLLAVNKMDLVAWDQPAFDAIVRDYLAQTNTLGLRVHPIPLSALIGDNLIQASERTPWYTGPTLLNWLEQLPTAQPPLEAPLRLPVQYVLRPHADFRGYCGTIAQGVVRPGDRVRVQPSETDATVKAVLIGFDNVARAQAGDAVCLLLDEERDISRGDVLAATSAPLETAEQFHARLIGVDAQPLIPGRPYWLKLHHGTVGATLTSIRHLEDPATGAHLAAREVPMNAVAAVHISLDRALPIAPYAQNRALGGFILIDRISQATVAAGMIDYALRRDRNLHWQRLSVDQAARAGLKHQTARCIWFTGLSGSGKSTIASVLLTKLLEEGGRPVTLLDGDIVRKHLSSELGFSKEHRDINIRRIGWVASEITKNGGIAICAPIAPYHSVRQEVRDMVEPSGGFVLVHVSTPLEVCEARDRKGLYAKARAGIVKEFTGISDPYEVPEDAEVTIDTTEVSPEEAAQAIMVHLQTEGYLGARQNNR